jgi:L-threonylcarbamoyladenylate synthase
VIAFPTDTVYGVGVSAFNKKAIGILYNVKDRSKEKAIPILISDPEELSKITPPPTKQVQMIIAEFWPGPLTLILPMLDGLPDNLSPSQTIGVRIPDHSLTRDLLRQTGPMAVTSANLSGEDNPLTADDVVIALEGKIDLILDGGKTPGGVPSTVLDCSQKELIILREGPISWDKIKQLYLE